LAIALLILSMFSFMIIPKNNTKAAADTELRGKLNSSSSQPVKDFQKAPETQQPKK
jgi:hypothetical protein